MASLRLDDFALAGRNVLNESKSALSAKQQPLQTHCRPRRRQAHNCKALFHIVGCDEAGKNSGYTWCFARHAKLTRPLP